MVHCLSLYSILTIVFVAMDLEVRRQQNAESDSKCIGKKRLKVKVVLTIEKVFKNREQCKIKDDNSLERNTVTAEKQRAAS